MRDRTAAGASLAATSRAAGLHKDWLCRHLATVDPAAAAELAAADQRDTRWLPGCARSGSPTSRPT